MARLGDHAWVKDAGLVGELFGLDPVALLKSDTFEWKVRMAAANHVWAKMAEDNAKAAEEINKNKPR